MSINENSLPSVRRTIRDFIPLADNEPADLVLFASFLCGQLSGEPIWLNFVSQNSKSIAALIGLIAEHSSIWRLPDRLTPGYFLDRRTKDHGRLLCYDTSKRILFAQDVSTFTAIPYKYTAAVWGQLRAIQDGELRVRMRSTPLEWRGRLGWIAGASDRFYRFPRRDELGARFLLYYVPPDAELERAVRPDIKAECRRIAQESVQGFMSSVIAKLGEYADLTIAYGEQRRLWGVSRLVAQVAAQYGIVGHGRQRFLMIREICRMVAFISGRDHVSRQDANVGLRIIFSGLPPIVRTTFEFVLVDRSWEMKDLLTNVGVSRRIATPILMTLERLGLICRRRIGRGAAFTYRATTKTLGLMRTVA